jgi:hypothetical protein
MDLTEQILFPPLHNGLDYLKRASLSTYGTSLTRAT